MKIKPVERKPGKPVDHSKNYISAKESLGESQMFKITRPSFMVGGGPNSLVKVESADGQWTAEMPMTQEMWSFFGEKTLIYCIGIPDLNHGLHILEFIADPDPLTTW